jgi:hypothetical protein
MDTLRQYGLHFGLWIARLCGWTPPSPLARSLPVDGPQVELARHAVAEVQRCHPDAPGPVKAREALRMLQNQIPGLRTRDGNFLIELALQER